MRDTSRVLALFFGGGFGVGLGFAFGSGCFLAGFIGLGFFGRAFLAEESRCASNHVLDSEAEFWKMTSAGAEAP